MPPHIQAGVVFFASWAVLLVGYATAEGDHDSTSSTNGRVVPTPTIGTKYGQLRGFYRDIPGYDLRVATYLGVPYATPPVGANRFSPTRTLSQWVGVHEARVFGPACPQKFPDISNETQALQRMSRSRLEALKRYLPMLQYQLEDCLYLNLYVPDEDTSTRAYPVVVFVHGESYEWGSASLYDGSVLAALGRVIVVTINYRLGILGFFNPNVDPVGRAYVANYGLMDQLAALHWVQENVVRFGGDPGHVTVMGHGTGAACLNFLIFSPAAAGAGLFKRAILMSGSALSAWATVQQPVYYAVQAARQLKCDVPEDLYHHWQNMINCLRDRTVSEIIAVDLEMPAFLSAIGPSVDGVTIRQDWRQHLKKMGTEGRTPVDVLLGSSATDFLDMLANVDINGGFEPDHRDRILRTFVHNNYHFHLQEIVLAITAEYTDWANPVQHPVNIRDFTAQALHDATIVAPMEQTATHFWTQGRQEYLYVLDHDPIKTDAGVAPEMTLNELVYVFGAPLGAEGPASPPFNFSKTEVALSEAVINLWTNFIKTGNPNTDLRTESRDKSKYRSQDWPEYDRDYRRYLELGSRGRSRDHYRASRVALWSWLVPRLEQVGSRYGADSPFHQLTDQNLPETFHGIIRPTNLSSNFLPPPTTPTPPPTTPNPSTMLPRQRQQPTVVVLGNSSSVEGLTEMLAGHQQLHIGQFPYTTALSLTVAIGCSLLILNLLVFAAVYYRRDSSRMVVAKPLSRHSDGPSDGGSGGVGSISDVQLRAHGDSCKPTSPSHCGTLRSSATLRSSLATSCDGNIEPQHDWPPEYTASCCSPPHETTTTTSTTTLSRRSHMDPTSGGGGTLRTPHNGTATLRSTPKPPPPPRSSSYPTQVENTPLLSPSALLSQNNSLTSEMRV